ncbi:monooxygenase [Pusillimonas sp.]|uniref:FAD-dependent oxidoreductase n=1 Tax=Pusillimonas sp. TaxID=3040095 RepID=UPI0029B5A346|nr:monooxygenase [Pusillimonas sp.]MDX3895580.1 monooxygenase [Pusillimonas sp.]
MALHHTEHAVVLGGSVAGLLTARVLSETFAKVTIVERETLEMAAVARRAVPQARHAHGLLACGREAIDQLFPGFTEDLISRGVPTRDFQSGFRWINNGRHLFQEESGIIALSISRPFLEWRIRAHALAIPNVTVICGSAVALVGSAAERRITGVRIVREGGERLEEILAADLIVDATGKATRVPEWLEALGLPVPEEERVELELAYASRNYVRAKDAPTGAAVSMMLGCPRGGVMLAQEEDRWIVTLYGLHGNVPPLDHEGFTAYATTLASPAIHEVIRDAEPISDAVRFRYPASVRRHYENISDPPEGFLALGDSLTSFSPVYGQGQSVAALEALELRDCLKEGLDNLASRFFKRAAAVIDTPWSIGVGSDLRFTADLEKLPESARQMMDYMEHLHVAAEHDPVVARAFLRVVNLELPPQSLMAPEIAQRVMKGVGKPGVRAGAAGGVQA